MYIPSKFEETRTEVMHQLMRDHPLGTLVTLGDQGLNANHLPFEIASDGALGTLRAHVARSNPVWRDTSAAAEPLVVFQGPRAYISPSFYPTKLEDSRVVPTYNYMVVHAYGTLRVIDDPAWIRAQLERLTQAHEADRSAPWQVGDAPADFIAKLLPALVGIEISITRLLGKWKVSQNQPEINRAGVEAGLRAEKTGDAPAMAEAVAKAALQAGP
ncbi:FMN-binding negative transcriptional regulator [Noviherbaspirillum sp. Root189]|uniref:FMN-binding negative transcriptional regulator n=1 Tax=Noviherbaspirillum sp. Root189 TaxID=1736487 RepID=UPI00070BFB4E|nr:FMN-binding negative transcriptional regulator [Noviherbaspirillum sp. Root189]KRB89147.1 transcriptional regulator [Noviherbaspirillum sp. Root189]